MVWGEKILFPERGKGRVHGRLKNYELRGISERGGLKREVIPSKREPVGKKGSCFLSGTIFGGTLWEPSKGREGRVHGDSRTVVRRRGRPRTLCMRGGGTCTSRRGTNEDHMRGGGKGMRNRALPDVWGGVSR